MKKLDKAKEIIMKEIGNGNCGIFNTRNIVGDSMEEIFNNHGLKIDICRSWKYFEVFGLSDDEFKELEKFYNINKGHQQE